MNRPFYKRRETLRQRARCLRAIRNFLAEEGILEINVPTMVRAPGQELHLEAFEVKTSQANKYLHTSPEYALKKVLADGLERIYSIGPCFRDEPESSTHSPEFTMLEWYIAGFELSDLMTQTEALIRHTWHEMGRPNIERHGQVLDLERPFERLTVRQAFVQYADFDPWLYETGQAMRDGACAQGLRVSSMPGSWDELFFEIFLNHVEPRLGVTCPIFLWGWPASQAALARLDPDDPSRALRFELFACGLELANAFDELTDATEQRRRFEKEQNLRRATNRTIYELDETLLEALPRLGQTCGIALGIDRLMMLLLGSDSIDDVLVKP